MDLIQKFANRIDNDKGYDNLSLAQDLAEIAKKHYSKQCHIADVVVQSEKFCECDGVQDLIAGTGECRKCGGQCTY